GGCIDKYFMYLSYKFCMYYSNSYYRKDLEEIVKNALPFEKLEGKNILVTGANGLIASTLVDTLAYLHEEKGINLNIYALCRNKKKAEIRFESLLNKNFFYLIIQDVVEDYNMRINFHYIIHAASSAHPEAFRKDPVGIVNTNVIGIGKLLEYAKINGNEKFLFISSSEVYGENLHINEYFEDDYGSLETMSFRSCYPESKRMAETLGMSYLEQYGINFISVRPAYIYGVSMNTDNNRVNEQFLRSACNNENIIMKSEGKQIRSYCYVSDCISALLFIMLLGKKGEAYNISNRRQNISIREFAEIIAEITGIKVIFEIPKSMDSYNIKNTILNSSKLESLGWMPKKSLKQSIENIVNIFRSL
ncbi:hypothetical protein FUSO5_10245, partial [Fusobacterium necrophorum BFTR-1]